MRLIDTLFLFLWRLLPKKVLRAEEVENIKTLAEDTYNTETKKIDSSFYTIYPNSSRPFWENTFATALSDQKNPEYGIVEGVLLFGGNGACIDSKKRLLFFSFSDNPDYIAFRRGFLDKSKIRAILFHRFLPVSASYGLGISLLSPLSKYYYHWLADSLPLSIYAFNIYEETGKLPFFFINKGISFQKESLILLGVPDEKIIEVQDTDILRIDNLVYPSLPYKFVSRDILFYSPFLWLALRRSLSEKVLGNIHRDSDKIYVSRADAGSRRVVNEEEVLSVLIPLGFRKIVLGDCTFEEQVIIFNRAKILITPHGAGLSNILFSSKLHIIELFPEGRSLHYTQHFYQMSYYLGHKHDVRFASVQNEKEDMIVNIQELSEFLTELA